MALEKQVGAIVMEVDGREIDVISVSPRETTGRRPVRTMNRSGYAKGYTEGMPSYDLSVTASIPASGDPIDWARIVGAKITLEPLGGGTRVSYLDCCTTEVGRTFEVDGEARISISMFAMRKVEE